MQDITQTQLYIAHFSRAVESHLTRRFIPMDKPHNRDSFAYVLSGTSTFTMEDGRVFHTQAGDVLYLSRGQDYSLEVTSEQYDYIVCDFLFRDQKPRHGLHIRPKNPPALERLFRKLALAHSVVCPDRRPKCMALLYQIYSLLIQNQQEQYVPGSAKMRIEQARIYIQTNIHLTDLSVAELAKNAQMSEVHFRKLFTDLYTISPAKYITQERISFACTLMELRELQLEDIALQSGFSSLPYFCKVFKATTGSTPGAYRNRLLKDG